MQILYHLNSFILALGFAMETNVIALPHAHTLTKKGVKNPEKRGMRRNAFIHYSNRLVAFSNSKVVTFHFTASKALFLLLGLAHSSFSSLNSSRNVLNDEKLQFKRVYSTGQLPGWHKLVKYELWFHKWWLLNLSTCSYFHCLLPLVDSCCLKMMLIDAHVFDLSADFGPHNESSFYCHRYV